MAKQPIVGHGPIIIEVSRSHSKTPHSSGRVIGPTQRPLPDNTTLTPDKPLQFEPKIQARERPQTRALDRAAIGIGTVLYIVSFLCVHSLLTNMVWNDSTALGEKFCSLLHILWQVYYVHETWLKRGTALLAGRSRVGFPMVSLEFFIDAIADHFSIVVS